MFLEDEVVNRWWCDILDYSYTLIISTGLCLPGQFYFKFY